MKHMIRVLFLGSLFGLCGTIAYSCTCLQTSHRKEFRERAAIFSGRVISVAEDKSWARPKLKTPYLQKRIDSTKRFIVRFEVERRFKGVRETMTELYAHRSDSLCAGMIFDLGQRWLIYADREPEGITDGGLCSRTRLLDHNTQEYKELRSFWFRLRARLFF